MENFKKKATIVGSAALALAVSTSSQAALTLLPNGGFEGTADMGIFADGDNGSTATFETSGGNPGGFGLASNTGGGWGGGFVAIANAAEDPIPLSDYGLAAGDTTTFQWDMKSNNGLGQTGIKLESWGPSGYISDTGNLNQAAGTDWGTFTQSYTFASGATAFKAVLVGTDGTGTEVSFDNWYIDAAVVPVPAAVWLFGSGLLGLVGVARRKKAA